MKLSVMERIVLLNLLPKEGNFANLKALRTTREALSFNEAENKKLNFQQLGNGLTTWNVKADSPKEIVIGEVVTNLIEKELKRLDETNKLQAEHLSVFEKFIK